MKENNLKKLEDNTNRELDEFYELLKRISTKNISDEDFEKLKEQIYKLGKRTDRDAKFLNLFEKRNKTVN